MLLLSNGGGGVVALKLDAWDGQDEPRRTTGTPESTNNKGSAAGLKWGREGESSKYLNIV